MHRLVRFYPDPKGRTLVLCVFAQFLYMDHFALGHRPVSHELFANISGVVNSFLPILFTLIVQLRLIRISEAGLRDFLDGVERIQLFD